MLSLFLSACGLKKMLPEGPAVDAAQRATFVEAPSGAAYSGEALTTFPVLPVLAFGLAYDLDLVIVSEHPEWNMHEYARLQSPEGPIWFAKDARESTMSQSAVADIADIDSVFPEVQFERKSWPVVVEDNSTEDWLDISLAYENIDGEDVEVTYQGKPPGKLQKKRNGSTMGHSRDSVLVALDVPHRTFGKRATVHINNEEVAVKRILGLIPFRMVLVQTQGGMATGQIRLEPTREEGLERPETAFAPPGEAADANEPVPPAGPDFDSIHPVGENYVRRGWQVEESEGFVEARQVSELRTLIYRFRLGEKGERELVSARVEQYGRDVPTTNIAFSPALPDLGHRFHGTVRSRFVIDINGQPGNAVGEVVSTWEDNGPVLEVLPKAPWWTTDRPLKATFEHADGGVDMAIVVSRED